MDRTTLAHELTHALQDQRFGLERLTDEGAGAGLDSEAKSAFRALVEGDASLLESQYTDGHIAPHEYLWIARHLIDHDRSALEQTPRFIRDSLGFPYEAGEVFVRALHAEGGWPAVDAAYADPPISTEQILHPERYLAGDRPRRVPMVALTDTLGSRWRWVDEDIVGEFALRQHIATAISPTLAAVAAEGWGGDRYVVFHNDVVDETALLVRTVWDSPEDAGEFFNLYSFYLLTVFGDRDPFRFEEDQLCWRQADDVRCLWWEDEDAVSFVRAPRIADADRIIQAVGTAVGANNVSPLQTRGKLVAPLAPP